MPRFPSAAGATAVQVRQEIDANSTRLDADMSSRAPSATALTDATWTNAKAVHLDADISSRNATTPPTVAAIKTEMDNNSTKLAAIDSEVDIRRVASGTKNIAGAATKYLSIDSGTNGAEIIGIAIKGIVGHDWTLDVYVPAVDAVAAPVAGDKRDTNAYIAADTEAGMLEGFTIPYNCFLDFTNDGAVDDIDDVVILYRSTAVLTLAWEA